MSSSGFGLSGGSFAATLTLLGISCSACKKLGGRELTGSRKSSGEHPLELNFLSDLENLTLAYRSCGDKPSSSYIAKYPEEFK